MFRLSPGCGGMTGAPVEDVVQVPKLSGPGGAVRAPIANPCISVCAAWTKPAALHQLPAHDRRIARWATMDAADKRELVGIGRAAR